MLGKILYSISGLVATDALWLRSPREGTLDWGWSVLVMNKLLLGHLLSSINLEIDLALWYLFRRRRRRGLKRGTSSSSARLSAAVARGRYEPWAAVLAGSVAVLGGGSNHERSRLLLPIFLVLFLRYEIWWLSEIYIGRHSIRPSADLYLPHKADCLHLLYQLHLALLHSSSPCIWAIPSRLAPILLHSTPGSSLNTRVTVMFLQSQFLLRFSCSLFIHYSILYLIAGTYIRELS